MIKYICDVCKKEITRESRPSALKYQARKVDPKTGVKAYIDAEDLYCEGCTDKILEKIQKMTEKK